MNFSVSLCMVKWAGLILHNPVDDVTHSKVSLASETSREKKQTNLDSEPVELELTL